MKKYFVPGLVLLLAGMAVAGCTAANPNGVQSSAPGTPAVTPVVTGTTTTSPVTQPTISLGDHYLQKSYSFHNTNDQYTEQFRIDDPSWAIVFNVMPLNDDPEYSWFEMTVTNIDTRKNQTFGYGRTYPYDTFQQYPMYTTGPYKIVMKGNLTKIDLDVAKRLP
jgi:hypothetical protein